MEYKVICLRKLFTAPYPDGHNRKLQTANQSPQLF